MSTNKTNKKGAQLERVQIASTQVVDTRSKRRQRGTKLDIDYTVKKNNAEKEQKFLDTEVVDTKLDKQILYEKRQNHTFIKPKLSMVSREDKIVKNKVLRGNERASAYKFMKEMVNSNKVQSSWNVERVKEVDEVDLFFRKKKTKPFSGFSIGELRDSLIVPSDDKNIVPPIVMSSTNEIITPSEEISVSAILKQLAALTAKLDKIEKQNEELIKENNNLKMEREQFLENVHKEVELETKPQEKKTLNTKKTQQKSLGVNLKITKTKIIGQEESLQQKFVDKPNKPLKPNKNMLGDKLKKNIREWYNFDSSKLEQHKKEVLSSVITNATFAEKIRETGVPKQKIRYTSPVTLKEDKKSIHYYGYKPSGIPNKVWWHWVTTVTSVEAYEKAERFLYNQFKREMFIYRTKWVKYSKEFNPYLSEPKMVWMEHTSDFDIDVSVAYAFILKWRKLVQTFKPNKPINSDWYKSTQQQ
ncbi:VP1 [Drosophila subobscura Nora virus]|uniref:VP1 n=1 Tax=Drosophila subobscura Nora virus TaxID=1500865 RepID=UPI0004D0D3BA|nr:VP1 [Drosophila subobscura Nora virus]AHZ92152.1 VP1 [Drosophila subobscura Nora virus]